MRRSFAPARSPFYDEIDGAFRVKKRLMFGAKSPSRLEKSVPGASW
jgi:hypothetical protein